jgi:hypothetical protein
MPPYIVIIFINVYIIPFVGNGPLWDVYHKPEHFQECRDYLWAKILLLNNFFGANVIIVIERSSQLNIKYFKVYELALVCTK